MNAEKALRLIRKEGALRRRDGRLSHYFLRFASARIAMKGHPWQH